MDRLLRKIRNLFRGHVGVSLIIICAALLLEFISAAQYYYTKGLLENELEKKASIEMTMKAILVKSMLNTTEQVLNSHKVYFDTEVPHPETLGDDMKSVLQANSYFQGMGIALKPGYYENNDELFELWAFNNGNIKPRQIARRGGHDYTNLEFYTQPIATKKPFWSDPYIDSVETHSLITTYSIPITDKNNQLAGIAGIDLSLEWLNDSLNNHHMYPSSYCLLLTDDGKLISQPSKSHPRYNDFDDAIRLINDPNSNARTVTQSKIKVIEFVTEDGQDACVFFHHMKGIPHWQVAVVCYDNEVFGDLNKIRLRTGLLMLLGFMLLGYIIYRFLKNNMRMAKNDLERERLDSELQVAKRIQSEMLPHDDVKHKNFNIAATLLAAREVGGDIYDYFLRDGKLFFCIGDASGKGVPSALIMSVTHSMFRSFGSRESNPARIMQKINQAVCHGNDSNMFVTFFIGVLDLPTGRLHYCNAGHDTPIIIDGGVMKLSVKSNLPLGVVGDCFFEGQEIELAPGATLLLYTDGLTEAMDARHNQFSLSRVMEVLNTTESAEPNSILNTLLVASKDFVADAEQSDDLTMLALQFTPHEEEIVLRRELKVTTDLSNVKQVNDFVISFCEDIGMEKSDVGNMRLAVEEAVVNIMNYAYPKDETGDILVTATATNESLIFVLTDNGKYFAPTDAPDIDTSLTAEERSIGGLGIFLVRQFMDFINYERIDGKNVLRLKKDLN